MPFAERVWRIFTLLKRAHRPPLGPLGAGWSAGSPAAGSGAVSGSVATATGSTGASPSPDGCGTFDLQIQPEHLLDGEAAQLGDLLGAAQPHQPVHRRLHEVDRVLGADALGQHVAYATQLEHGADATAGDHAGTGAGRAQDHMAGAEAAVDLVGDRFAVLGDPDQVLARVLDPLLDRQWDLARLAVADPDHGLLVADGDQGGEREATAALDHLGDAVDLDHPLLQVEPSRADRLDFCAV